MPEQSRAEPGNLGAGSPPSNGSEAPKGAGPASAPKTSASPPSAPTLADLGRATEAFRTIDLTKPDPSGGATKLAAVSSRAKDSKAAGIKAETPQPLMEKRRMSTIAPEAGKTADVTKVETPRMPGPGRIAATPLGEKAWEIKGLTPPRAPDAGKSAEPPKGAAAAKPAADRFSAARVASRLLGASLAGLGSLGQRARGAAKSDGAKPATNPAPQAAANPRVQAAPPRPESRPQMRVLGNRRVAGMAAVVALATLAGAVGGALATSVMMTRQDAGNGTPVPASDELEASVTRIDADVATLKSNVDQLAKAGQGLMADTGARLDRLEIQQADLTARLSGRSGDASDRLQSPPPQAATAMAAVPQAMSRDTTGAVTQSTMAAATSAPSRAAPKTEAGRLPVLDGWVLRDVARGGAVIEGRHGFYEVYAGDPVPGLGRVDAIRKQDGRWVVVTTKGLIVSR